MLRFLNLTIQMISVILLCIVVFLLILPIYVLAFILNLQNNPNDKRAIIKSNSLHPRADQLN